MDSLAIRALQVETLASKELSGAKIGLFPIAFYLLAPFPRLFSKLRPSEEVREESEKRAQGQRDQGNLLGNWNDLSGVILKTHSYRHGRWLEVDP